MSSEIDWDSVIRRDEHSSAAAVLDRLHRDVKAAKDTYPGNDVSAIPGIINGLFEAVQSLAIAVGKLEATQASVQPRDD